MTERQSIEEGEGMINRVQKKLIACPAKKKNVIYLKSFKPRENTKSAHYGNFIVSLPHTLSLFRLFLSTSVSFSGFQLISSPQLQSLFHQQKELQRLLKAMRLCALLPPSHYTQRKAKTSLLLCLSTSNWLRAVGPGAEQGRADCSCLGGQITGRD